MKIISTYTNGTARSKQTEKLLTEKLQSSGFSVRNTYSEDAELLICIGGDGAFLHAVHNYGFPQIPIVGVNTGHLGFFQEISPDQLEGFIENYNRGKYRLQKLHTVKATVEAEDGRKEVFHGLNEIVITGTSFYSVHLNISIGGSFIEKFSGDGILVATSSGSTAYNYSLGGSIVDPRIKLLQVTPIAPMNTTAYRSFTSSIMLPSELSLGIVPELTESNNICVINDGIEHQYTNLREIRIEFSDTVINLLRFESYDFWDKVKTKFL